MNSSDLNGRYVDTMLAGASQALDTELEKVWTDLSLVQPHVSPVSLDLRG
jgi:hypothetical protein